MSGGAGIKVAVIDAGIFQVIPPAPPNTFQTHADLQRISAANVFNASFTSNTQDASDAHGTHVSGIIGAKSATAAGVIGVAPDCELIIIKVQDPDFGITPERIQAGIKEAISAGAMILNLSFGDANPPSAGVLTLINEALKANMIVVAAAGDDATLTGTPYSPANIPGCICVGAISPDQTDSLTGKINPRVDFILQQTMITSCGFGEQVYEQLEGCSMSAAFVSGLLALGLSAEGKQNAAVVIAALRNSALSFSNFSAPHTFQLYKP
jgi:subtilisin family serine protease